MLIHLHKQATTTPKVGVAIQASDAPASVLTARNPQRPVGLTSTANAPALGLPLRTAWVGALCKLPSKTGGM